MPVVWLKCLSVSSFNSFRFQDETIRDDHSLSYRSHFHFLFFGKKSNFFSLGKFNLIENFLNKCDRNTNNSWMSRALEAIQNKNNAKECLILKQHACYFTCLLAFFAEAMILHCRMPNHLRNYSNGERKWKVLIDCAFCLNSHIFCLDRHRCCTLNPSFLTTFGNNLSVCIFWLAQLFVSCSSSHCHVDKASFRIADKNAQTIESFTVKFSFHGWFAHLIVFEIVSWTVLSCTDSEMHAIWWGEGGIM